MKSESVTDWTLEQAAEHLGKSVKTIRRMLQAGSLSGYKVRGPNGAEWRVKPLKVSEMSDEDDQDSGQLLKDNDGKIEDQLRQTESLLSEQDREIKQLTDRLEQSNREQLEAQLTLEHTNKQLAQMSERLHTAEEGRDLANKERDAATREAAELKGQVQALKTQVGDLMSQLAECPVQEPIKTAPPDMTPAAEETCHAPEEPAVLPEQTRTVTLILHVKAKNAMQCPIGHPMQSRENIEKAVLSRFGMKQLSNKQGPWESTGEYELVFSDDAGLDQQVADLCRECNQEASKLKCSAKCEIKN